MKYSRQLYANMGITYKKQTNKLQIQKRNDTNTISPKQVATRLIN